jgi:hypothetical protein
MGTRHECGDTGGFRLTSGPNPAARPARVGQVWSPESAGDAFLGRASGASRGLERGTTRRTGKPWTPRLPVLALGLAAALGAGNRPAPIASVRAPACAPMAGNVAVAAVITPPTGLASVRVYFRKGGEKLLYYLEARASEGDRYWAVLPKPEAQTKTVDYSFVSKDGAGRVTSTPFQTLRVSPECAVACTSAETASATNLVVGETAQEQRGLEVVGFLCDGIISRINVRGDLLPDEQCRRILATGAVGRAVWLPIAAIGAGGSGVVIIRKGEQSQARP